MSKRLRPLSQLRGEQLRASNPVDHAGLSASAGTGKTHVLTARVLRLLLSGADPGSILCLTFTKAGAAEMADRIHARLAYWVRLKGADLAADLQALGEDVGPEMQERARTLFASVLEAHGGGLRIQTIHAFAQSLLAGFPAEAGLVPGFRPLDGREEQALLRRTLADLLVRAEREGDAWLVPDLQALSHRLGEGGAEAFLTQCARAPVAMAALGPRQGVEARLRRAFDLPAGDIEEAIVAGCCDDGFDVAGLRAIAALNAGWGTRRGAERATLCEAWLAAAPAARAAMLDDLHQAWAKKDGEPLSLGRGWAPPDENYAALAAAAFEQCGRLLALRRGAALVSLFAAGLRAGQAFAAAYADAKRAAGAVDFDDLIRTAESLLLQPGIGDWVRYKLDQGTDHILVDEAQDTNVRQWNIVRALSEEFFAGESARGGGEHDPPGRRTIFTVGDYKQAIFGFQGTDPRSFDAARLWFSRAAEASRRDFLDLSMDRSFRSSPPVLAAVDRLIADLGHDAFGLPRRPNPHESFHQGRPGSVTLWRSFAEDAAGDADDAGEEGWIGDAVRRYAGRLARQVRTWLDAPFQVGGKGKERPLRPEDILILVRRRGDLAALLVARLHAEGVPVAGVDRLSLSAPLAVQDLLAAARFAMQPLDDLNLSALLVSPLLGWSQDDLFAAAHGRAGPLWTHLRAAQAGLPGLEALREILAMADYATPHEFFETILSGKIEGRRKLLARLGPEARDPIEELLSSALDFDDGAAPSLQRFLDWFARGDVEIVRDPSAPLDAVRVMTVHGAKGLQAPVVILADACADPDRARVGGVAMPLEEDGPAIPFPKPRKDERIEPLAARLDAQAALDRQEHWRLLYVAMTRAEERLYVGGALGPADRNGAAEASWHAALERTLIGCGCAWEDDPLWGEARRLGEAERPARAAAAAAAAGAAERPPLPDWLSRPAPAEQRPPRPLVPSDLGDTGGADPPPSPAARDAARRGKLLHALFERLPGVPAADRARLAERWLAHSAGVDDPALRKSLADDACAIIADPRHAELFGPEALAEAPIAAVVGGGVVVSGTVDRLLVEDRRIVLADFKTGRAVPAAPDEAPAAHLRQMAAYRAALRVIFPDRPIEAALLYTAGPTLHALPDELLDRYAPAVE